MPSKPPYQKGHPNPAFGIKVSVMGCKWLIKETGYTPLYPIIIRPSTLRYFICLGWDFSYLCWGEMQKGHKTHIYSMYGGLYGPVTHGRVCSAVLLLAVCRDLSVLHLRPVLQYESCGDGGEIVSFHLASLDGDDLWD